jgi:hypothetical protein
MGLPKNWQWLEKETGPKLLLEALKLYGTTEVPGIKNNPEIMAWAKELGLKDYTADSIPWCGLAMAYFVKQAGYTVVASPLWAQNWKNFGVKKKISEAMLGDVLVYVRDGGGHVNIYVGEDNNYFYGIGGNQSDMVNITKIAKSRCISVNRCPFKNQPENIRKVIISDNGLPVSTNEA